MANHPSPVVVRIRGSSINSESTFRDWLLPSEVNFRMVLDVISQVLPGISPLPTAYEYVDEDGDRITVCSDQELSAMISYCQWRIKQYGTTVEPLTIYPKDQFSCVEELCSFLVDAASKRRNPLKLEVNTRAPFAASAYRNPGSGEILVRSGSFKRASEQNLIKLLSEGQIAPNDLQYLEILGHGSGGTVYRTFHQPSKIIMAVKVLALDATAEEQKQIKSELEILHKCNSHYIIGFYGAFFHENRISICTEYMDGGSLDSYGSIPEEVLGRVAVAVVKGLSYLWSLKIMHRDIKPSNMLVNTHGHVKLCDFGVSVQLLTSLTKTFIGTNAYMAPERILGGEYGIHSEIWSLGVSLLEMAIGRFPYLPEGSRPTGLMPFELLQCIVNEKPPSLPPDRFSPQIIDFTTQCMQKMSKARPGIDGILQHPFLLFYDDENEEVVSQWVRKRQEQLWSSINSKRYPSDMSLASTSSSASAWSGVSGHSGTKHLGASGHSGLLGQATTSGHGISQGGIFPGHSGIPGQGGGAFQFMDMS